MTGQPRQNENRFYRYPKRRIVAVIDDDAPLDATVRSLSGVGVDAGEVNVLSGPDGARLLDRSGADHGLRARLLRLVQGGAFESDALRVHEQALNDGRHVIYVPVQDRPQLAKAVSLLRAAGGRYLLYFGAWSVEQLPVGSPVGDRR
jgi:hypothetical protein